jgi:hypothetical protein
MTEAYGGRASSVPRVKAGLAVGPGPRAGVARTRAHAAHVDAGGGGGPPAGRRGNSEVWREVWEADERPSV